MIDSQYYESKMQSKLFFLFANLILTALIYYNAELGRALGIKGLPLSISLIWPATGFSLAALLLFGLKTWPGIFLGNFIYNYSHLSQFSPEASLIVPFVAASLVSIGSLFQALLAYTILKGISSPGCFSTVKDIIIFLIPAGLLSCMLASSLGVLTLSYFYGTFTPQSFFNTWLTFWIGDSMGVYTITPLIVVWAIYRRAWAEFRQHLVEFILIIIAFVFITVFTFIKDYPLVHLYIPLIIWVAYRFRMQGATLVSLLITLAIIIATFYGHGPFSGAFKENSLLFLVTLLEIIVATSLIIAAIVNERDAAWQQIQNHNIDLQQVVSAHLEERKGEQYEMFVQEKLGSLGLLTSGIARQLQVPIERIYFLSTKSHENLKNVQQGFNEVQEKIEPKNKIQIQNNIEALDSVFSSLARLGMQVNKIGKVIEDMSILTAPGLIQFKFININTLIDQCLNKAMNIETFSFAVVKEFDKGLQMFLALPEDIGYALFHCINYAIHSMKEKKQKLGGAYTPQLKLRTQDNENATEIVIFDNGLGASELQLKDFFSSLVLGKPSSEDATFGETTKLSLAIAHDIIVRVYHGQIKVDAKEGEFTKITITVPKNLFLESHK